jgi:hypothetical protein
MDKEHTIWSHNRIFVVLQVITNCGKEFVSCTLQFFITEIDAKETDMQKGSRDVGKAGETLCEWCLCFL